MTISVFKVLALFVLFQPTWAADLSCEDDIDSCAHGRMLAAMHRMGEGVDRIPLRDESLLAQTDVLHYNLALEIIPSSTTLSGTNIITVKSLANGVTQFPLQLHQVFTITSLQVNGVAATWTRQDVANLTVELGRPFDANEEFQVLVQYSGVPSSNGFGSIRFTEQGFDPLVYTLSEPFYAHTWWPVKEDNTDKATGEMAFTVPNTMTVASNGVRQGIDVVPGGKLRHRWRTDYPTVPYLFCFATTVYNEFTDVWHHPDAPPGGMLMQFFIYPMFDSQTNRNAWLASKQMLTTFSDLYGVYPFANEKYGICQFGFSGGMEHQTMTGQSGFGNNLTAHEVAHHWWGDLITCSNWHDIWLNEGFASYSEALWLEFQPGSTGTAALLSAMAARRPSTMGATVYRYDASSATAIFNSDAVYRKGAWVLHMLRRIMGDQKFFQTLLTYREEFAHGSANTDDFRFIAQDIYGGDLNWFFQPWIYFPGAPTYQTAWRNIQAGGQDYLELYIRQVQSAAWPTYKMPIDIRTTSDGVNTFNTVWNDERAEHLLFPVSSAVTALAVDPNAYVLKSNNQTTTFVEGPPKVVRIIPGPGSTLPAGGVSSVQITFHRSVNALPSHFSVVGQSSGAVALAYAYDPGTMTATLTPRVALMADEYTLTIDAAIANAIGGQLLDGEIANPRSSASLPSGDGLPGGNSIISFSIETPCPADITNDQAVAVPDLLAVITSWGSCDGVCSADIAPAGGDGQVGVPDLLFVISSWGACR